MSDRHIHRATCPGCGRDVALRKDGSLWRHQEWTGGPVVFPPMCAWSGRRPDTKETRP